MKCIAFYSRKVAWLNLVASLVTFPIILLQVFSLAGNHYINFLLSACSVRMKAGRRAFFGEYHICSDPVIYELILLKHLKQVNCTVTAIHVYPLIVPGNICSV